MAVAIILARGGSKGLPGKNLSQIGDTTLLGRAIRTVRQSAVSRIIVSSDDSGILREAQLHGAETIKRPAALAGDRSTSQEGLLHAIRERNLCGPVVHVQCTNPFLHPADVDGVLDYAPADLAICVQPCHDLIFDEQGGAVGWSIHQTLRQQRPKRYRHAGSVWGFSAEYVAGRAMYEGEIKMVEARHRWQVDIDTAHDLLAARRLLHETSWVSTE